MEQFTYPGVNLHHTIELMLTRASCPKLSLPAPDEAQLQLMLQCALRAPDHGRLHPWRYLGVRGDAREQLGSLFADEQQRLNPGIAADKLDKCRQMLLRAPLVVVAVCSPLDNVKVPQLEQLLSCAAGVQQLQLAANALGFHSIWRTGDMVNSQAVREALGLAVQEVIVGFVYVGTATEVPSVTHLPVSDFYQDWSAS